MCSSRDAANKEAGTRTIAKQTAELPKRALGRWR